LVYLTDDDTEMHPCLFCKRRARKYTMMNWW